MLLIALLLPGRSNAQLPCNGVDTDCVLSPTLPYKCITGPTTFQAQINQGNLVSADQSAGVVQRIIINGNVTVSLDVPFVEYTFPAGSEIVYATKASTLTIVSGSTLRLIGAKIYGCHEEAEIWGIRALSNSTLIAEGCEFADGPLSIGSGSNISIVGNTFKRSIIQLQIENGPGNVNFTVGGSISGNRFFGDDFLKFPYEGKTPAAGMGIDSDITVGKLGGALNEFRRFGNGPEYEVNGIYVSGGDVTILNTTFHSIAEGSSSETNAAIRGDLGSNITIQGLGYGEGASNTFQNCKTGVYLQYASVDISNAKFTLVGQGVLYEQPSAVFPSNFVKVNTCRFNGFLNTAIKADALSLKLSAFEVQNCIFDDNSNTEGNKGAVFISTGKPSSVEQVKINNNKVYFRDRSPLGSFFILVGFYLGNLQKGRGENNEFYDEGAGETIAAAVRMDGCNGFVWSNNDFIGNNTVAAFGDKGFLVYESPNCIYSCNYLSGTKYGMWFEGLCNSTLYQNSFNDHNTYGLYLYSETTVIGGQYKKYNTWSGNPGAAEAFMYYEDPFDAMYLEHVKKSQFTIQTDNQNTAFWANPRIVGNFAVGSNDLNWFVGPMEPTPPSANICPPETYSDPNGPKLDYGDKGIVDGTFTPWKGYAANTWDAAFLLYQRMTEDASLRPAGSPEAAWYASNYNSNLGKFRRAFDGFVSLSSDAPTVTAAQLLSDLNAIAVTTTHEQNLKTDLLIFLEQYTGNGTPPTPQQTTDLTAIADQCRYEGGIGVVLARLALGQPSTREGDCTEGLGRGQGSERSSQAPANTVNAAVFPNPVAEQAFSVQLDRSILDGAVRLVDLQGRVLGNWTFSGDVLNVREANASPGVYLLEVLEQGHILSRNKLVFSR